MRTLWTILLLAGSNTFMTTAWYYHLKKHDWGMLAAIGISWLIALPEYCLQVPANRLGHIDYGGSLTAPQLKVIQEAITLAVFAVFSTFVLHEKLKWTDWAGFVLVFLGVAVARFGPEVFPSAR